ncbi:ABC transporter permease [Zhengella mangrovi]|uniref:ABC transporter permease n=1 Tax=Zhengella mangrovi TaxID=1982044 RepID=A0A2G1QJE5_9HYPH|nr:SMP-30/gluconolactonase/LRE family protein [Zhengella mangrovi]PHP65645.1 ABC transporter permease [Zhengella mangrovi]
MAHLNETLTRIRYRIWPDHVVGEILSKPWMETAIPVLVLVATFAILSWLVPGFFTFAQLSIIAREGGELGFIVLGLSIVIMAGGVDLSVGSIFAVTNFIVLLLMHEYEWSAAPAVAVTILAGMALGAVNGILIGYLRLRAFLTTLITLIIFRAVYEIWTADHATAIAMSLPDSATWDFLGIGLIRGIPVNVWLFAAVALACHVLLTRLRPGWHLMAIGGSRRAAYNAGIAVRRTIALTYVASGGLTAIAAIFFGARLASVGGNIGVGMEVTALTAAVLGGITLGGGRGSVTKAIVGLAIVLIITNGMTAYSASGGAIRMTLAAILVAAAVIDIRWIKNRHRIISSVYVSPDYLYLPPPPSCEAKPGNAWAVNDTLRGVDVIGLGEVEGPEDVILDRNDNLYSGSRHGDIVRFLAPDYKRMEIFAHIGGQPLGLAFDREDNLNVCVGGMGLYQVSPAGEVRKLTDETNRSWTSVNDDSRLRLADDLDIADDGRIFFSEATRRYEMSEYAVDALESRPAGRIICHDPRTGSTRTVIDRLRFPNGISMCDDGQSFLFAQTSAASVSRYWFDGPKKGRIEVLIDNLPGYPDNINKASDGNYWVALVGMRGPALDLAMRMPGFRKRMTQRLPFDEWMFPNINNGCVFKINLEGKVLYSLWDPQGINHPMITSMREHKGWLYLGGLSNNRIGRYKLPESEADPAYVQYARRWGLPT